MSDLQSLYQQLILDHSRQRHGYGLQAGADAESHQLNPLCGDAITLQLHVSAEDGSIAAVSWEGQGCAISTASASVLAQLAPGTRPADLVQLVLSFREMLQSRGPMAPDVDADALGDAVALHGVSRYPARVKCAMLAWVACEDALRTVASHADHERR